MSDVVNARFVRNDVDALPEPGQWKMVRGIPMVKCGGSCDEYHRLRGWDVSASGVVTRSVLCLMPNCGWHAMVTLHGWAP